MAVAVPAQAVLEELEEAVVWAVRGQGASPAELELASTGSAEEFRWTRLKALREVKL